MTILEHLARDVRYALRTIGRSPGFTAAVVVSLALGIGANTAIFTLMDAVMLRWLPVRDPQGLLAAGRVQNGVLQPGFTYRQYRALVDDTAVADLAAYASAPVNVSVDGPAEAGVQAHLVTGGYFSLLGLQTALGRAIGPDDDRAPNAHAVAVLSHGYWERRFARDPSVLGRTIRVSAVPFTIVGVAPPGFFGVEIGAAADLFVPIMMQPIAMPAFENLLARPINNLNWVRVIARVKPGIDRGRAAAVLDAAMQTDAPQGANNNRQARARLGLVAATDVSALRVQFSRPLVILLAVVAIVLITACANTASLLLARGVARRRELAMRLALGAGRAAVLRQLVVESLVLAGLGGACGALLARWATDLLVRFMSAGRTPIVLDLAPNLRILAFTAAVSVLTGLVFGLAPAWRATRIDLAPALRNVRGSGAWRLRPGRALAIAQLALSLLLLVTAGLFVRSLQALSGDDDAARDRIVTLRVEPRGSDQRNIPGTAERLDRIYRELIQRAKEVPDVRLVSMAQVTPTAPMPNASALVRVPSGDEVRIPSVMVYPDYFAVMGIPVLRGRDFAAGDLAEHAPPVCVVNESFVRQVFRGEDPIGKPCTGAFAIVGVMADSRYSNPTGAVGPIIYRTFLQTSTGRGQMVLHVRVAGNTAAVIQRMREHVASIDPAIPTFSPRTLEEEMNAALVRQRLIAMLSTLFGGLTVLLACVGLYGLLAFTVVQRTGELGIRMALGAGRHDVLWLVAREALYLVAAGLAVGIPAALAAARAASNQLSGLLFGLEATDPATIASAACSLAAVALIAAYAPARRASRVDPMVVLRAE